MTESTNNFTAKQAAALLTCYGFELTGYSARTLIYQWLKHYQAKWIHLAVVEALYQGRYKAISVEQILSLWLRRGQPTFHFSHEFERLICHNLPQYFIHVPQSLSNSLSDDKSSVYPSQSPGKNSPKWNFPPAESPAIPLSQMPTPSTLAAEAAASLEASSTAVGVLPTDGETSKQEAENRRSIHEFTPLSDSSELYSKLRAVIHQTHQS